MKTIFGFLLVLLSLSVFAQERLSDMIPHPFYVNDKSGENQVMSVVDGYAAFQLRLEMIRRAQKNIEVEYFIYNTDMAGKILSRELVEAAKRGVKVRILIDKSKPIFKFTSEYAKAMSEKNVEVRYYNNAPLLKISSVQFRNHRKILSIDDAEAISGGRNIGDDYFDLSHEFNFNDTDIYVKGPIVKTMRESFDAYFDHKISERPNVEAASSEKEIKETEEFLAESQEELRIRERLATFGKQKLEATKLYSCPDITYVTDAPGARFRNRILPGFVDRYKFVRKTLFDKINEVDKSVLMSSPYMLINKHAKKLKKMLLKKNVTLTVYTNSLASTDAIYVASNLYFDVYRWIEKGVQVHLHDGKYIGINENVEEEVKNARWGTHSKVQIYESSKFTEAAIGTYNIDNRSNFYNSEMMIFCRGNDEFTAQVKGEVEYSIHKGIQINLDGTAQDREGNKKDVFGSSRKGLIIMNLIFLPSWLLKFLL